MFRLRILLNGAETTVLDLESGKTYTAGRAPGCEIALGDFPGISRQHFRLSDETGAWVVQVMSKFGEVQSNGLPVSELTLGEGVVFRVPPYDFSFLVGEQRASSFPVGTGDETADDRPVAASNALATIDNSKALSVQDNGDFDGNDEKTAIGRFEGVPYLKIANASGSEETLRLEGNLWIAGREENCEIFLNDLKSSRKQFELASTPKGFFVTDLSSANGTLLNGSPLPPNQAVAIRSGDAVTVGSITISFEIRDPNFKNKLIVIPQEILEAPPVAFPQASGGDIVPYGGYNPDPGAMSPYAPQGMQQVGWPEDYQADYQQPPKGPDKRKKILIVVALLVVGFAVMFGGGGDETATGDKPVVSADPKAIAFQKLSEPQKKMVKDTYQLAQTLFMQKKFELASDQLKKIHEILPEGYEESHQIIEDVENLLRDRQAAIAIENEKRILEQQRQQVESIIKKCNDVANTTLSVTEIQNCVAEAVAIDPENQALQELVARVEGRLQAQEAQKAEKRGYQSLIAKRRALYTKALAVDKAGDTLGAIAAYGKFLSSKLPDSDGNVAKAQARLQELKGGITKEIARALKEAQRLYEAEKLKEAYAALDKVRQIDPENTEVAVLSDKIVRELNQSLQAIYSDSVLEESLGQIQPAKEKWRKILAIDRPNGEYYRRARSKLRQYGNQ